VSDTARRRGDASWPLSRCLTPLRSARRRNWCQTPLVGVTVLRGRRRGVWHPCQQVYETLRAVDGVELLSEPAEAFWGGGFDWRRPGRERLGRRVGERDDDRRPRRRPLPV